MTMTVPEARKIPALARFHLRRHKIPLKGGRLSIVSPRAMEDLVAAMDEEDFVRGNETLPYWAQVWASSVALARKLCRGPSLAGRRILDLGCGVGVAGTAAFSLGADVEFADAAPEALAFARFNAEANRPNCGRATVRTIRFDWFEDRLDRDYDRILAADVVYEDRNHGPILQLLRSHLSRGGSAWIADPHRAAATCFLELAARSFDMRLEDLRTWFPDRWVDVRVAEITLPRTSRQPPSPPGASSTGAQGT